MKINNYTIFESSETENWNYLRDSDKFKGFFIPSSKSDYMKIYQDFNIDKDSLNEIQKIILERKIKRIISFCSGTSYFEFFLKDKLKIKVIVSDYTDSIERIKNFNIFDDTLKIDINREIKFDFKKTDLILLSRIDTEFTDNQLVSFFKKLWKNDARNIYLIPAEILNLKTILIKIKIILMCFIKLRIPIKWGYIRSNKHFLKIFGTYFESLKLSKGYLIYKNAN